MDNNPKFNLCINDIDRLSREVKFKVQISIEGSITLNAENDMEYFGFDNRRGAEMAAMIDEQNELFNEVLKGVENLKGNIHKPFVMPFATKKKNK